MSFSKLKLPTLYEMYTNKVQLYMDKDFRDFSSSTAAYLNMKEPEEKIKCVQFEEMSVKSPHAGLILKIPAIFIIIYAINNI